MATTNYMMCGDVMLTSSDADATTTYTGTFDLAASLIGFTLLPTHDSVEDTASVCFDRNKDVGDLVADASATDNTFYVTPATAQQVTVGHVLSLSSDNGDSWQQIGTVVAVDQVTGCVTCSRGCDLAYLTGARVATTLYMARNVPLIDGRIHVGAAGMTTLVPAGTTFSIEYYNVQGGAKILAFYSERQI
jgi:hypothetical protein